MYLEASFAKLIFSWRNGKHDIKSANKLRNKTNKFSFFFLCKSIRINLTDSDRNCRFLDTARTPGAFYRYLTRLLNKFLRKPSLIFVSWLFNSNRETISCNVHFCNSLESKLLFFLLICIDKYLDNWNNIVFRF